MSSAEGEGLGEATTRSGQGRVKIRSDTEASQIKALLPGGPQAREGPAGAAGEGLRVWLEKAEKERSWHLGGCQISGTAAPGAHTSAPWHHRLASVSLGWVWVSFSFGSLMLLLKGSYLFSAGFRGRGWPGQEGKALAHGELTTLSL